MTLRPLTEQYLESLSLKGGCTGSSESIYVKMTHCSQSHVAGHIYFSKFCVQKQERESFT